MIINAIGTMSDEAVAVCVCVSVCVRVSRMLI